MTQSINVDKLYKIYKTEAFGGNESYLKIL